MSHTGTASTTRGQVRTEPSAKRVRAYLGGEAVADSIRPVLVWEVPYYPAYYFPVADVRTDLLEADGGTDHSPSRGDGHTYTVSAGGKEARGAAVRPADGGTRRGSADRVQIGRASCRERV